MKSSSFIGVVLLFSFVAPVCVFAQETPIATPTPSVIPKVDRTIGKVVALTWPDGREAEVRQSLPVFDRFVFDIEIVENTCATVKKPQCSYSAGFGYLGQQLVWSKHEVLDRVDKPVKVLAERDTQGYEIDDFTWWTMVDGFIKDGFFRSVPSDQLTCTSWDWLGFPLNPAQAFNVPRISVQQMVENPETGQLENRTLISAGDVKWKSVEPSSIEAISMGGYDASPIGIDSIYFGDVIVWQLEKSPGAYCEISLKPNLTQLGPFLEALGIKAKQVPYKAVVFQNGTYFTEGQIAPFLDLNPVFFAGSLE